MTCLPIVEGSGDNIFIMQDTGLLRLKNTVERVNGTIPIMTSQGKRRGNLMFRLSTTGKHREKAGGATDEKLIHSGFIDPSGNHLTPAREFFLKELTKAKS